MNIRILLAGLLGGLAMFVWSALAHTVLPLGQAGMSQLPDERAAVAALQPAMGSEPRSGFYLFPWMSHAQPAPAPGPSGLLIYHPDRPQEMTPSMMLSEALSEIVQATIAAFLLSLTVLTGYRARVGFVALLGVPVGIATNLSYWIWFGFPTLYTLSQIVIVVVAYAIAGAVIAAVLRRRARAG